MWSQRNISVESEKGFLGYHLQCCSKWATGFGGGGGGGSREQKKKHKHVNMSSAVNFQAQDPTCLPRN